MISTSVTDGGLQIGDGGTAIGTTVVDGGTMKLGGSGVTTGVVLNSGSTFEAGSGYVLNSALTSPGISLSVGFGGLQVCCAPAQCRAGADIMGGTRTSPESLSAARDFVRSVACVPLPVQKEILGFCFNSVWRAVKRQSLYMWAGGFVDFRDIDRAWMVFTGMTYGPFFLMDLVGLGVIFAIEKVYFSESGDPRDEPPLALKEKIGRGELGLKTGKGFYTYPDPECARDGFLQGK